MAKKSEDIFDAIVFRDTPGAPLSYDDDDAFSVLKSPNSTEKVPKKPGPSSPSAASSLLHVTKSQRYRSTNNGNTLPQINESRRSKSNAFSALPPKVVVSVVVHEEATSVQEKKNDLDDIISHVRIEGNAHAQLVSSNAKENPPFELKIFDLDYPDDDSFNLNKQYIIEEDDRIKAVVVPKKVTGQIQLASWERTVNKRFMPVLLQSKVVRAGKNKNMCVVTIQLRSNLNNKGSLKALTATIAVPPTVISTSLNIKQGGGTYDDLKRVITWTLKEVPIGKSLIFDFEVGVLPSLHPEELPKFPILVRCRSTDDTISNVEINLENMHGHPATLVVNKYSSFRLLHRLPS